MVRVFAVPVVQKFRTVSKLMLLHKPEFSKDRNTKKREVIQVCTANLLQTKLSGRNNAQKISLAILFQVFHFDFCLGTKTFRVTKVGKIKESYKLGGYFFLMCRPIPAHCPILSLSPPLLSLSLHTRIYRV